MQWHDEGLEGLTFDDVLIRPAHSGLLSRQDANCITTLARYRGKEKSTWSLAPIMLANMKTIATWEMMKAMSGTGIIVPSHRFQTPEEQLKFHHPDEEGYLPLFNAASVGLGERDRAKLLANKVDAFFLELAHADSYAACKEVKWLKKEFPDIILVAGNVATRDGAGRLFEAGADLVKVGIGPGSVCTTRIVTGCGVPQLSAILECAPLGPIIADGGIKNSGDIVKALAAGAKFVMVGSLFAGTDEAAGERIRGVGGIIYYGMASREAGRVGSGNVPEGIAATVPYAGSAETVAEELMAGVRQGMAMVGAETLEELREKAIFQRASPATLRENQPHIRERACI